MTSYTTIEGQNQMFNVRPVDSVKYRTLGNPQPTENVGPRESPVHELYPGRPMTENQSAFDRNTYPHEYPQQAKDAFENRKAEMSQNAQRLEAQARNAKSKMTSHQVDDPSQTIEDPQARFVTRMEPPAANNTQPWQNKPKGIRENFNGHEKTVYNLDQGPNQENNVQEKKVRFADQQPNFINQQQEKNMNKPTNNKNEDKNSYVAMGGIFIAIFLLCLAYYMNKK